MYKGDYNGKNKHQADLDSVLERAVKTGLERIIVTAGDLTTFKQAISLIDDYKSKNKYEGLLWTTCGVHPTMVSDFEKQAEGESLLDKLLVLAEANRSIIAAVGEFGLDYERLQYADKATQQKYFEAQFFLADRLQLPLFLHMRECAEDFMEIIKRNRHRFSQGVVHSFTGTPEEALTMIGEPFHLYIGINGCSLKTQANLDAVKAIPLERMMIETDAPWCEIRPTHAGAKYVKTTSFPSLKREKWAATHCVKGRNEPCNIINVLEVIAAVKELPIEQVAQVVFKNAENVFFASISAENSAS